MPSTTPSDRESKCARPKSNADNRQGHRAREEGAKPSTLKGKREASGSGTLTSQSLLEEASTSERLR